MTTNRVAGGVGTDRPLTGRLIRLDSAVRKWISRKFKETVLLPASGGFTPGRLACEQHEPRGAVVPAKTSPRPVATDFRPSRAGRISTTEHQGLTPLASDYRPYGTQNCSTQWDSGGFNPARLRGVQQVPHTDRVGGIASG